MPQQQEPLYGFSTLIGCLLASFAQASLDISAFHLALAFHLAINLSISLSLSLSVYLAICTLPTHRKTGGTLLPQIATL